MRQLAGWREVVSPVVLGTGNLPDPLAAEARPLLFVGNHTRFGLFDLPLLVQPSAPPAHPCLKPPLSPLPPCLLGHRSSCL